MSDLLKLLDGSVNDVKAGLAGKSRDDLIALRSAEQGGKTRSGVIEAINAQLGIDGASPAPTFEASGAPHQIVSDVNASHPAVDTDSRAGTTEEQNRIDFNDPTLSGQEAVERNLSNAT